MPIPVIAILAVIAAAFFWPRPSSDVDSSYKGADIGTKDYTTVAPGIESKKPEVEK